MARTFDTIPISSIENVSCKHDRPQFPDPSVDCTFQIRKDFVNLEDIKIKRKAFEECDSTDFDIRKQGDLLLCGEVDNAHNGYDITEVTVRQRGNYYLFFISAFDY